MATMAKTPNFLNATFPLKQDAASQEKIADMEAQFGNELLLDAFDVLRRSELVHYARFTLIRDAERKAKFLQVLTEYDGDFLTYAQFFADNLAKFFNAVFEVVEGAPPPSDGDRAKQLALFQFIQKCDLPCLGGRGFSAYGDLTVMDIQRKFAHRPRPEDATAPLT